MSAAPRKRVISAVRRRLCAANVLATAALVFSMSGAAVASQQYLASAASKTHSSKAHYKLSSASQISPGVMRALQANTPGVAGPTGAAGVQGAAGGPGPQGPLGGRGAAGAPGATGPSKSPMARTFHESVFLNEETGNFFELPGGLSGRVVCIGFRVLQIAFISFAAPEPSSAQTSLIGSDFPGSPLEDKSGTATHNDLSPTGTVVTVLHSNAREGVAVPTHGDLDASISTPSLVARLNMYITVNTEQCIIEGAVFATPRF